MAGYHIGIVGGGAIAREHALSLVRHKQVSGLSVFDPNRAAAEKLAADFDAQLCKSLKSVVEASDLVWICSPPFAHGKAVELACERGLPIFCEKPLALKLDDALAIRKAVRKADVPFFMGHSGRYTAAFQKMKQLVDNGTIGDVRTIWSTRYGWLDPRNTPSWRMSDRKSGGVMVELGIHEIDFVRWMGGDWKAVHALGSPQLLNPRRFQDNLTAMGRLRSGALARVAVSWASSRYLWQRGVEGTKGELFYDDARFNEVALLRPGKDARVYTVKPENWRDPDTDENVAFRAQLDDVLKKLARGDEPTVTLDDGLAALRVALATGEAAKRGEVISIRKQ